MSREIKFRVWDKKNKKIDKHYGEWLHMNPVDGQLYEDVDGEGGFKKIDDVVLMQYTGIKDKNGKEIYEGDIIRPNSSTYSRGIVIFSGGRWNCDSRDMYHMILNAGCRVVGNIYESSEVSNPYVDNPGILQELCGIRGYANIPIKAETIHPTEIKLNKSKCADCGHKGKYRITEQDGKQWYWCGSCYIGG